MRFNNWKLVIGISFGFWILSFGFAAPAAAYFPFPSLHGPSGLTRIPDGSVLPYKNWNFGLDYGTQKINGVDQKVFIYKANLGTFHNFELGLVGGLDSTNYSELRDGVYVNIKYSPTLGDGSDPLLLAIGVENLASKTQNEVYMVATKPLNQGPSISFGFMADFPNNNRFRPLGMAGIEFPIGPMSILADCFAGETVFQLNGGIRYRILSTLAIEGRAISIVGNQQAALATKDPQEYTVSLSWVNPF